MLLKLNKCILLVKNSHNHQTIDRNSLANCETVTRILLHVYNSKEQLTAGIVMFANPLVHILYKYLTGFWPCFVIPFHFKNKLINSFCKTYYDYFYISFKPFFQ